MKEGKRGSLKALRAIAKSQLFVGAVIGGEETVSGIFFSEQIQRDCI